MDHIFQKPDIEEICTAAKKAITDTKDCIADIRQTAAAISAAAGSVPEEAKTGDLAGTAGSLHAMKRPAPSSLPLTAGMRKRCRRSQPPPGRSEKS